MSHLLPPAGISPVKKGDEFRFNQVFANEDQDPVQDSKIPLNIHDYRWTDYEEADRRCRAQNKQSQKESLQRAPEQASGRHQHQQHEPNVEATGWGFCPPRVEDPRVLIRPRDAGVPDETRPTGKPYFSQEAARLLPPQGAPLAEKGGFNLDDWQKTVHQRMPPDGLRGNCVPSLCRWCEPIIADCCPNTSPSKYELVSLDQ